MAEQQINVKQGVVVVEQQIYVTVGRCYGRTKDIRHSKTLLCQNDIFTSQQGVVIVEQQIHVTVG